MLHNPENWAEITQDWLAGSVEAESHSIVLLLWLSYCVAVDDRFSIIKRLLCPSSAYSHSTVASVSMTVVCSSWMLSSQTTFFFRNCISPSQWCWTTECFSGRPIDFRVLFTYILPLFYNYVGLRIVFCVCSTCVNAVCVIELINYHLSTCLCMSLRRYYQNSLQHPVTNRCSGHMVRYDFLMTFSSSNSNWHGFVYTQFPRYNNLLGRISNP